MSTRMSMIFSILAIKGISALPITGGQSYSMQSAGGSYSNQGQYKPGDECANKALRENRIIEGVTLAPNDPATNQLEDMERKQRCMINKAKIQQEFTRKVGNLFQKTKEEVEKAEPEKKKCVSKLDRGHQDCFVNSVLNDFYTSVVWKVAVHNNVAQLWYHDKLAIMIVYEPIHYSIKPEEKECLTFFPTSDVAAEENALGHVVRILGKPITPGSKTASECRPCTDFLKKTVEGKGMQCANSCDTTSTMYSANNFKSEKAKDSNDKASTTTAKAKSSE